MGKISKQCSKCGREAEEQYQWCRCGSSSFEKLDLRSEQQIRWDKENQQRENERLDWDLYKMGGKFPLF